MLYMLAIAAIIIATSLIEMLCIKLAYRSLTKELLSYEIKGTTKTPA